MSSSKRARNICPKLERLRELMVKSKHVKDSLAAYVIPHCDAHMSEYVADCDKRLEYISGFTGSAGLAIVTQKDAMLWTDGRYHTQAEEQLNRQHWLLMKSGMDGVLTEKDWLVSNLEPSSKIGYDPKLVTYSTWLEWEKELKINGLELVAITDNLVDIVGHGELVVHEPKPIVVHPIEFSGESTTSKISRVKNRMNDKGADILIISALDEIAWLLNLRGSDVEYNPVFFAYLIIAPDSVHFFTQRSVDLPKHDAGETSYPIAVHNYNEFFKFLENKVTGLAGNLRKIWVPTSSNYYIYSLVPSSVRLTEISPIQLMKSVKNTIEVEGMVRAHIKCATALCRLLCWLESAVPLGGVTELGVARKLEEFRDVEENYKGPSFLTIASSGPNSAIIHYAPSEKSDRELAVDEIFLCDSGCQFLDGTTDVTRTVHFGVPTEFQKYTFTKVFRGQTNLATAIFPEKLKGNYLDSFARKELWDAGLDYQHGTSHGVGSYLHVHEGPQAVSWRDCPEDPGLLPNMMLSNEPGYYKRDSFGIRLENIVQVVPAEVPHSTPQHRGFLTFKTLTLVPIQTKLLDINMLTEKEVLYLNNYHKEVLSVIGPILRDRGYMETYEWLVEATKPISS